MLSALYSSRNKSPTDKACQGLIAHFYVIVPSFLEHILPVTRQHMLLPVSFCLCQKDTGFSDWAALVGHCSQTCDANHISSSATASEAVSLYATHSAVSFFSVQYWEQKPGYRTSVVWNSKQRYQMKMHLLSKHPQHSLSYLCACLFTNTSQHACLSETKWCRFGWKCALFRSNLSKQQNLRLLPRELLSLGILQLGLAWKRV